MSDEQVQTFEEVASVFYPDAEAEPLEVPTVEAEEDEAPAEEVEESTEEVEEEVSEDEVEGKEEDDLTFEIDGKDYSLNSINEWQASHENIKSMQADCTKKWQEASELRKQSEADITLLDDALTKTNDLAAQLEVLVGEDGSINWAELKEDDPDRYIELKERADSRKSKLEEVKANNQTSNAPTANVEAERVKLIEANPQWIKDDKPTQAYKDDMNGLEEFYKGGEWTQDQVNFINGNAKIAQLVLESVRRNSDDKTTTEKKASAKKKIIATPKSGKVKATTQQLSAEEIFYGKN